MITEYLKEEQIFHVINRVIVAKHEVSEQYLCEIEDRNPYKLMGRICP